MVRNRVGGPVVNETEHKTINWNSYEQVHIVQMAGHVPMHGPPGLDSVPPIVGNVPILVKEVVVRSVVGSFPVAHSQETLQTRSRTPNQTLLSNIANMRFCIISPGNSINTNIYSQL